MGEGKKERSGDKNAAQRSLQFPPHPVLDKPRGKYDAPGIIN